MTVGERIKLIRETKGISQTELANKINVSKQNLYKYENNIITHIPYDKIEAIASVFEVSPAYLIGWEKHPQQSGFSTTTHEINVLNTYRNKPELQFAVDRLLGVGQDENFVVLPKVARRNDSSEPISDLHLSKEKLNALRNAEPVNSEDDL